MASLIETVNNIFHIITDWLLIILGISHLVGPSSARKTGWGLSWIAVGAIILLNNLGVIAVGIQVDVVGRIQGGLSRCGARDENTGRDQREGAEKTPGATSEFRWFHHQHISIQIKYVRQKTSQSANT